MTEHVRIYMTPRRWWRWAGLAGVLVVYVGLRCGAPLRVFYGLDLKGAGK